MALSAEAHCNCILWVSAPAMRSRFKSETSQIEPRRPELRIAYSGRLATRPVSRLGEDLVTVFVHLIGR